ncbi:undecaprenyldiphospho-muramoylpentapeptide beta-N-acetylglucosaminyltransferase [Roseospira visakhapatnamensis]|uniref:UDP-N-acetylglucosamine--N-acetylmuramyl-(pentapeptide) pyrophosphoryl-undecaprenol N-acetylglucosamine transferase n=1 Tax=Roseospira visakhapatnamensis TaxID=390880 RepID=A0A7W6RGC8_9PROT|nr:undecaprenyldiphospho-muramoylpentapeptide beta-N-acetylglucosaminyltransferase [Roseospira visakhapatnamensis]MBB4267509.1 UDP-N-acetylglucosamine--N-acetylmuramyl-(pentapeptide) pyrophosphoryl-undecaprenol N-acetylglucosamine transferase [Roseospira visakhapatnamensis]
MTHVPLCTPLPVSTPVAPGRDAPFIVLAAGGTGGHVFPAEALAAALEARGCRLALVTDRRGQGHGGATLGGVLGRLTTHRVQAGGIAGRGLTGRVVGLARLIVGAGQAWRLLRRLRPDVVVGFGGYAAFGPTLAASLLGLPTVIHEQNAVLGRANRLLAGRARMVATALPTVRHLPAGKGRHVGNPVRPATLEARAVPYDPPAPDGPVRLLVTGGSQGARALSDLVPVALAALPETLRARLSVAQQCRPEDLDRARATYAAAGIAAETAAFFDDIPARLAAAHLVLCRAGASTVAELTCAGRPAVLIPFPFAVDDHQTANARALDEAGAAWLMPQGTLTPDTLSARLAALLGDADGLAATAARARALGRPDAAERLAALTLALADPPDGPTDHVLPRETTA